MLVLLKLIMVLAGTTESAAEGDILATTPQGLLTWAPARRLQNI
jgi:hypothetical protein